MSSKISFEGIGEVVATFACGEGVAAGQVVKVTEDGTVGPCTDGEKFCGVALSAEDGYAAVQLGGGVPGPGGGLRVDQVDDGLRLGQVHPAVQKGPLRELARLGLAHPAGKQGL